MSKHFHYYDAWRSAELECPTCHWKGKFSEGSARYYRELQDCSCPKCDSFASPILAIVSYPTLAEMATFGSPSDIRYARQREEFLNKFNSMKLVNKDQLPEVESESFSLAWDFVETNAERSTVIRHNDRVLFLEPALWEGFRRFEQVCKIVRARYGARVIDLAPTSDSEMYLFGDVVSSPGFVGAVRRATFSSEAQPWTSPPPLRCPECAFGDGDSGRLAEHLIEAHKYGVPESWFAVGQENERLYPRFKAPSGKFSVLGTDNVLPTGEPIATCNGLEEAIEIANRQAGSFPEISVYDDSCKELYAVLRGRGKTKIRLTTKSPLG